MMTRLSLHLLLILGFLSGSLVPAGLTRCQVETSCCGCGPALEKSSCCCGPMATSQAAPSPAAKTDVQVDWTAPAVEPAPATNLAAPVAGTRSSGTDTNTPRSDSTPLFLAHRAFLI